MKKKKTKFRDPIAEAMHETVRGLHRLGLVDNKTMREFDVRCLTSAENLKPASKRRTTPKVV